MKVTKLQITKLLVEMDCTCKVEQEYVDLRLQTPKGERGFLPCEKHKGQQGEEIIKMVLNERLDEAAITPAPGSRDPNISGQGDPPKPRINIPPNIRVGTNVPRNPLPGSPSPNPAGRRPMMRRAT